MNQYPVHIFDLPLNIGFDSVSNKISLIKVIGIYNNVGFDEFVATRISARQVLYFSHLRFV